MKQINMRDTYEAAIGIRATSVTMANAVNELTKNKPNYTESR